MVELIFKSEVYAIIGAAMDVHKTLGCGFLEAVYQEALEMELKRRDIPYRSQQELSILYKGQRLRKAYLADFVVYDKIIVEIKANDCLSGNDEAQIINYLKATGFQVGLLINFGASSLEYKRKVLTDQAEKTYG